MNNEIITSINVNKLFNQFSYNIAFQNNNISILIGPNGTGKTTIMDFLSFVFVPTPKVLKKILSIPFESFGFDLSNGWNITFNKKKNNREDALLPNNVVLSITTSNQPKIIDFEEIANSNKQQVLSFERGDNERPYNDRAYLNSKSWASDGITVNYERLTKLIADEITLAKQL